MADNSVSACIEQHVVMKFLVKEGVKSADIYRRLQGKYGDETLVNVVVSVGDEIVTRAI